MESDWLSEKTKRLIRKKKLASRERIRFGVKREKEVDEKREWFKKEERMIGEIRVCFRKRLPQRKMV